MAMNSDKEVHDGSRVSLGRATNKRSVPRRGPLHTDVAAWPEWQKEITEARIEGAFEPGTSFDWISYDFPVTSTIYDVKDRSRSLWGGTAQGITGIHEWLFTETPTGVHVETNESFAGEPVEADVATMQSMLDGSLAAWLGHLKSAAESNK
jgi:hypothetical protein